MDVQSAAARRIWLLRLLLFTQVWLTVQGPVAWNSWLDENRNKTLLAWVYIGQAVAIALVTLSLLSLVDLVGRASLLAALFGVFAAGLAVASGVPESGGVVAAPVF